VRINLSEQTDMMDLLGADLPVAGGGAGQFAWADGPLLAALQRGDWVLLDELNLASARPLAAREACSVCLPSADRPGCGAAALRGQMPFAARTAPRFLFTNAVKMGAVCAGQFVLKILTQLKSA